MFGHRVGHLLPKGIRKCFIILKAKLDIAAALGNVGRIKQVIPDTQRKPVVHTVWMVFGQRFGVMPNMHLWVVKNILERSVAPAQVGVIQMPDGKRKKMNQQKIINTETDHRQRNILYRFIDHCLHPVEAQVRGKTHLFYRMMQLMKLPQPVQHAMHVPLNEIGNYKQSEQLPDYRPTLYFNSYQVRDAKQS